MAECFLGRELDSREVINHLDFNRLNNKVSNLELTNQEGNVNHYWKSREDLNYTETEVMRPWKAGENHHNAKLTRTQVKEIIYFVLEGQTNRQIADKFGVHDRYISLIRHKRRWKTVWKELGLEGSTTIPSGSKVGSHKSLLETETALIGL